MTTSQFIQSQLASGVSAKQLSRTLNLSEADITHVLERKKADPWPRPDVGRDRTAKVDPAKIGPRPRVVERMKILLEYLENVAKTRGDLLGVRQIMLRFDWTEGEYRAARRWLQREGKAEFQSRGTGKGASHRAQTKYGWTGWSL